MNVIFESIFGAIPVIAPISRFFAVILEWLNGLTGNFTLSVILLTVAFRVVVLPLSIRQTKSMIEMQRIQPLVKEIQKKYKGDKEKQGQEMMKLYKEHKVNPLGGCLPLLVQLPLLFALFDVLHSVAEYTRHWKPRANFAFLGMKNVTLTGAKIWSQGEYIPLIVLALLTVITGYVSSKMMTTDPQQSKMMALMPVMMGVFAWILPIGVTIYIIVTNILTIIQQYIQLEVEGFYEEKRSQKVREKEPSKALSKIRYRALAEYLKFLERVGIHKGRPEAKKTSTGARKAAGKTKKGEAVPSATGEKRSKGVTSAKGKKPGTAQRKAAQAGKAGSAGKKAPAKKKGAGNPPTAKGNSKKA